MTYYIVATLEKRQDLSSHMHGPDKVVMTKVGSPELDFAAEYLLEEGHKLTSEAKKTRPDLLVQVGHFQPVMQEQDSQEEELSSILIKRGNQETSLQDLD